MTLASCLVYEQKILPYFDYIPLSIESEQGVKVIVRIKDYVSTEEMRVLHRNCVWRCYIYAEKVYATFSVCIYIVRI